MPVPTRPESATAALARQRLARREAELHALLHAGVPSEPEVEAGDFKDLAVAESLAQVTEAQAAHAVAELQQLQRARHLLDEGRYGICSECGEAIDARRLQALPATTVCAACQADLELLAQRAR